ncbi:hypothetical protein, partial [Bacteroides sp.]|uniref:hypothetical protein n=1 Tax=Bacteroides sp. TaxID=29523 RepID=UPI003AB5CC3B
TGKLPFYTNQDGKIGNKVPFLSSLSPINRENKGKNTLLYQLWRESRDKNTALSHLSQENKGKGGKLPFIRSISRKNINFYRTLHIFWLN